VPEPPDGVSVGWLGDARNRERKNVAMSKASVVAAAAVVFCVGSHALADAAGDYQTLFGQEERAIAGKAPKVLADFAAKLFTAARSVTDQTELQALLCEKAYEYGTKAPAGYTTAIDAMKMLMLMVPERKEAAQAKVLEVSQLRYARSKGEERKTFGLALADLLIECGDQHAEAKQTAEALALYRQALTVATAVRADQAKAIAERIKQFSAGQDADRRLAILKARVEKDPADVAARTALVLAYLGELDEPAEAAKLLTADLDEGLRTYVPLAAKNLADLEEATCIELAEWFSAIADKAAAPAKGALFGKAIECCQRFLDLHTTQDAGHLKAKMLLDKAVKAAGPGGPRLPKSLTLELAKGVTMKLAQIAPGKFIMGSPKGAKDRTDSEGPQHEVTISKPFYMGIYEVTQEQYEAVTGKNPSEFEGKQNPVDSVSWDNAAEFCEKLSQKTGRSVRLPTEAQWEYACRAGSTARFFFGDDESKLGDYAWYAKNSGGRTHPVGQKKPNAFGLYDMYGNLWEWCFDRYADSYTPAGSAGADAQNVDPQGPSSGKERVLRGRCWFDPPGGWWTTTRHGISPGMGSHHRGFRLAVEVKEKAVEVKEK
jgi:formylglycine-generating enzyme required for sulfatase activity